MVEGDSGPVLQVLGRALDPGDREPVAVTYTVNHATTNGGDLQLKSGTTTIAVGQISQTFQVKTLADTTTEPNEAFTVDVVGSGERGARRPTGVGTILNDDPGTGHPPRYR